MIKDYSVPRNFSWIENYKLISRYFSYSAVFQTEAVRRSVLINFAKFTRIHLCQRLFFNKLLAWGLLLYFLKELWHRCFSEYFAKSLRIPFYIEHFRLLFRLNLMNFSYYSHWPKSCVLLFPKCTFSGLFWVYWTTWYNIHFPVFHRKFQLSHCGEEACSQLSLAHLVSSWSTTNFSPSLYLIIDQCNQSAYN